MTSNSNQPKTKKVIDWIKFRNIKEATVNYSALVGLKRVNKIISRLIKFSLVGFTLSAVYYYLYRNYTEIFQNGIKNLESKINSLEDKRIAYLDYHIKLAMEYGRPQEMDLAEDNMGIIYYREKLLKEAYGLVLETCCGSFRNKNYYTDKVSNIIGVDWCKDVLNFAFINSTNNSKFVVMDCVNLDYQDNSFDTVVDTFGLQSSYDHKSQFEEMKRVCKVGGKILLLEIGESFWKSTNFKIIRDAPMEFFERGQHLYKNWDDIILKDPSVKITKRKRKLNGRLFYYELEKLY